MAQDILKKVTLSKLGVEKDWILEQLRNNPKGDEPIEVAAFVGMISGVKSKTADYGDYILFEGDFKGINLITGLGADSAALIVPPVAETPLMGMYKRAIRTDDEGNVLSQGIVEFAFTVTIRKDKAAIGYAYGVRNHADNGKASPLLRLLRMIPLTPAAMKNLPLLDAPAEGEEDVAKLEAPKGNKRK